MSHSQFGRIERGAIRQLTIDQLCRASAAVGLRLIARAVPDGDPALDAGQLALLSRLRGVLPANVAIQTEVPLPIPGDRRAWDAVVRLDELVAIEAEARLRDVQALDRKLALKQRDDSIDRLILLVADTKWNRGLLELHRDDLRARFPLDSRAVLSNLRAGRAPDSNGLLIL